MKKLYALLVILIILYIGINVGANNINFIGSDANSTVENNGDGIVLGDSTFSNLENFNATKISDSQINLFDADYNMTINVSQIDNSQNISEIANNLINSGDYTSNQVIDQNGVTSYFLYQESADYYNADIFFSKNNQNYQISGAGITYDNSDYFINNVKNIIDTLSGS